MIGDAVPIRFSRRIQRKASLSPVRVSVKRKTRRLAVKKRTPGAKSSLLKTTENSKVCRQNKSEKNPKQTSSLNSSLCKVTEKTKLTKKSKLKKKISKQILKQASHNLKSAGHKRSRKDISKIFDQKRRTRYSLKASQDDEKQRNLELSDEKKKAIEKKNYIKFTKEPKQSACRGLRVSKSLLLAKGKRINKKLKDSKLKSSRMKKPTQKKCPLEITSISSKSVLTPNIEKSTRTSRHSERKISARLSAESLNQEVSLHTSTSKSLPVTPHPEKITRTTRHSENLKSTRSSKSPNQSRILNSEVSLNTSAFLSILETPHPKKHLEKRKSARLLEPSPLKTLNKELPLSTPASILRKNQDSMISKSSKLSKSAELQAAKSHGRKQGRPKVSNKEITTDSCEKLKPTQRRQVSQQKKPVENFKMPLSKETVNLPLDVLTTSFTPIHVRSVSKKCISKSKSSKRKFNDSLTENHVASKEVQDVKKRKKSSDLPKIHVKGTLKHKRWLLNHLKETNNGYEDDIFENQSFGLYNQAFHFGDESDGSSVNIATPKFECILTPTLPKKTPRFKDCISPTELLQARKTAEEYLYRRNKKRKSGDRPSSSGKKTSMNKNNTTESIPEKKKLDYEETVNKLIAVQKNLEKDSEFNDEEEDSYFSDASN